LDFNFIVSKEEKYFCQSCETNNQFVTLEFNFLEGYIKASPNIFKLLCLKSIETPVNLNSLMLNIHPDDKERFFFALYAEVYERKYISEVLRVSDKKGHYRIVKCHGDLYKNELNITTQFIGKLQDVSDLYYLSNKLVEEERRYEMLIHNSPVAISISQKGKIHFCNKALADLLGFDSVKELRGQQILEMVTEEDKLRLQEFIEGFHEEKTQKADSKLFKIRDNNDNIKFLDFHVSSFFIGGEPFIQTMIFDHTSKLETERRLRQLALDTLYFEQCNEAISNIKLELEQILKDNKQNLNKNDFQKVFEIINTYNYIEKDKQMFSTYFSEVFPDFVVKLRAKHPDLSPKEVKLCICLKLNFDTKQTANVFNVKPTSVQIARVRLKRKLNLLASNNLWEYITGL
jgi:PAS domain S-box-containing protein